MVTEVEDLRQEVSSLKVVVLDLQNLKGHVEELNTTVNSINSRVADLDKNLHTHQYPTNGQLAEPTDHNEMWLELQECQNRAKNIMLFNVPEKGNDENDIATILGVLSKNPPAVVHFA